jgi:hypothetical protein
MISSKRRRETAKIVKKRLKDVILAQHTPELKVLKQPGRLRKRTGLGHNKPHWCCNHKGDRKSEKDEDFEINQMAAESEEKVMKE